MATKCEVCVEALAKYKCSVCYSRYCSSNCWKKHKSDFACEKKEESKVLGEDNSSHNEKKKYFTEDTVSEEKLSQLGESEALKKLLNNKYLQSTLIVLENSTNPEVALKQAMRDPEFVEFVDECLKVIEGPNN